MMKQKLPFCLAMALLAMALGTPQLLLAAVKTSAQTGLFSDGSTWVGGAAPAPYDDIVIAAGHTVTLDAAVTMFNITIESGATLDNSTFDMTIGRVSPGNPIYTNNGVHNGTGNLVAYDDYKTELSGSGTTNCSIIIRNYGLSLLSGCQLTINGNIQHESPGNTGMNGKVLIEAWQAGAQLTVNGNVTADEVYGGVGLEVISASISISGNLILPGSSDAGSGVTLTVGADASLSVSGDLSLGPFNSYCQNSGTVVVGGDLTGAFDTYFIQEAGAVAKFGGGVFAAGDGYLFAIESPLNGSSSHPNTIEYNGIVSQQIAVPADMAYSNLIISNIDATANIETDIAVNGDLSVKPEAALTVGSGGSLTVGGAFTIESDATGTGSFISGSSTTADIQRYIAGHNNAGAAYGWHLLSAPVGNQAISAFHTAGSGDDFYKWSEADALWINRTNASNELNPEFETNFVQGSGYLIANVANSTKTFSGTIQHANLNVSGLSYTGSNAVPGWHLLGNPFSSALQWNDGNWALNQVDANAQLWNEATASYNVLMPNGIIPAMNGFFVHASQNNASLTIPAVARTHASQSWYKDLANQEAIVLVAKDPAGGTAQITMLRFNALATDGYDSDFDSYFMAGFAPRFYSVSQQAAYALNTMTQLKDGSTVMLGFVKNESQHFEIELVENPGNDQLYLQDHQTNTIHQLNNASYAFSSSDGDDPNRFSLHFGTVGIDEGDKPEATQMWYSSGTLHIDSRIKALLMVYDVLGNVCYQEHVTEQTPVNISPDLKPGAYLAVLQSTEKQSVLKFIVHQETQH